MVDLLSVFWGTSFLTSLVAGPLYTPASSEWGFPLSHPTNICYFFSDHSDLGEIESQCCVHLHLTADPWDWTFLYVNWPFVLHLVRLVCLFYWPIYWLGCWVSYCLVFFFFNLLYALDMNLFAVSLAKIFSHSAGCLFTCFFCCTEACSLHGTPLPVLTLFAQMLETNSESSCICLHLSVFPTFYIY